MENIKRNMDHYFSWIATKKEAIPVVMLLMKKFDLIPQDFVDAYLDEMGKGKK